MHYFSRIVPYVVGAGLVLLVSACSGADKGPVPTQPSMAGIRVQGSIDCSRSPYSDYVDRARAALGSKLEELRLKDRRYGLDMVITVPGQERTVVYNIGVERQLTEAEKASLSDALTSICPQ